MQDKIKKSGEEGEPNGKDNKGQARQARQETQGRETEEKERLAWEAPRVHIGTGKRAKKPRIKANEQGW